MGVEFNWKFLHIPTPTPSPFRFRSGPKRLLDLACSFLGMPRISAISRSNLLLGNSCSKSGQKIKHSNLLGDWRVLNPFKGESRFVGFWRTHLTGVFTGLEGPVPSKLKNLGPQGSGCVFEALSSCLVTRRISPASLSIPVKTFLWNLARGRKPLLKAG